MASKTKKKKVKSKTAKTTKKEPTSAAVLKKVATVSDSTKTLSKEIKAMTKIFSENQKVLVTMKNMIDSLTSALEYIQKQSKQINILEDDTQKLFAGLNQVKGQSNLVIKINDQTARLQEEIAKIREGSSETEKLSQKVSQSTHAPFVMDGNCRFAPGRERSRVAVIDQSRCILTAVSELIDSHRASQSWDDSLFIVTADHGLHADLDGLPPLNSAGSPSNRAMDTGSGDLQHQVRVANANPVLAIHFPGANGEFRDSWYPAQISDIPATICQFLDDCSWANGISLYGQRNNLAGSETTRYFLIWTSDTEKELFRATGPIWEANSWEQIESDLTYRVPTGFRRGGGQDARSRSSHHSVDFSGRTPMMFLVGV